MNPNHFNRAAVRAGFDRAARRYDALAVLQHEVGRRMLERLEYQRLDTQVVLDIGCGTGLTTRALQAQYPQAMVLALDWSLGMLTRLCEQNPGPVALCADMQCLPVADRSIDLVFSNFAGQWSPDPERLFSEVRRVLRPGGLLLFSMPGPDTLRELRAAWSEVDSLPHVHAFIDLHDVGDLLMRIGFAEPVMDMDLFTLDYPDVPSLMRELRALGAGNALQERRRSLTGKGRLARLLTAYESFRSGGRYQATCEVVYGAAFGPVEGQPTRTPYGEVARFSADSLRIRQRK